MSSTFTIEDIKSVESHWLRKVIDASTHVLVAAGAGMSVDSGLATYK